MRHIAPSLISGRLEAPPSKSVMQRAVIAAALANGQSVVSNPTFCDDALAALGAAEALGATVSREEGGVVITGGGEPKGGRIDCGESGTCMRMIAPVAALSGKEFMITGRGTLMSRPMSMLEAPLRQLGAECGTEGGKPPITVKGPLRGGSVMADGSESSQHISGLLMALPKCAGDSELAVENLKSAKYVAMTVRLMADFGVRVQEGEGGQYAIKGGQKYRPRMFEVEGDWSGAAFVLVAGAIAGEVEVCGLHTGTQADEAIKSALLLAGAHVEQSGKSVRAERGELKGFEFDASGCPDLFPPLAVLACNCDGRTAISGASRLRHKESDRAAALAEELGKLGASIKVDGDVMLIEGRKLAGGRMRSRGDHRIAMAGAVAALASEKGVGIEGEDCVSKSYPQFFRDLESVMVRR